MNEFSYSDKPARYITSVDARRWVLRSLSDRDGAGAVQHRPVMSRVTGRPLGGLDDPRPVDPLAALLAARQLFGAARSVMTGYAGDARAVGHSWEVLGAALGLDRHDGDTVALAAFDYLVPDPVFPREDRALVWRCGSCGELVTDRGPYGHPADTEDGHAGDCARHHTDIHAWETRAHDGDTDAPEPGGDDD